MAAPTIGLLVDLETTEGKTVLAKAIQHFRNKDFRAGVKSVSDLKARFVVAAGRLDLPNDGVFIVMAQDEPAAMMGLVAANARLAQLGAALTRWVFVGSPEFQQRAMKVAQSSDKGTTG
jgi:hypothetical protein